MKWVEKINLSVITRTSSLLILVICINIIISVNFFLSISRLCWWHRFASLSRLLRLLMNFGWHYVHWYWNFLDHEFELLLAPNGEWNVLSERLLISFHKLKGWPNHKQSKYFLTLSSTRKFHPFRYPLAFFLLTRSRQSLWLDGFQLVAFINGLAATNALSVHVMWSKFMFIY